MAVLVKLVLIILWGTGLSKGEKRMAAHQSHPGVWRAASQIMARTSVHENILARLYAKIKYEWGRPGRVVAHARPGGRAIPSN